MMTFKKNIKKVSLVMATLLLTSLQAVIAQGDDCVTATPITTGSYSGTTVGFAADVVPFCGTGDGSGGGVWYSIQGSNTCMAFTLDLCAGTTYDSKIRVFDGTCGALNCVTGIDDFCGLQSQVTFNYTPGTTYFILVHGFGSSQGNYTMNVTEVAGTDITAPVPGSTTGTDDQAQLSNTTCMAAFSQTDVAQSFIPVQNTICGAGIELSVGQGTGGDVTISLWDNLPNVGGAVMLATGTAAGNPGDMVDVTWPSVSITPGLTYYLVATSTDGALCWAGNTSNPYPNGQVYANGGFGAFPTFDYVFHTFYGCGTVALTDVSDPCVVTSIPAPTAYDECSGVVTGVPNVTFPITTQGTTVVTWTYTDGSGNSSSQNQNVIITDATAPVADAGSLSDVTGECSATPVAPTATDNCVGSVNGTPDVTFPITTQGTTVVTWTYTDAAGNTSSQTQNVILTDVTAPVADAGSLTDVTDECSATPVAPTATDNCIGSVIGTPDVTFPITTQGTTVVTWTYTDAAGNTSSQTQNVILTDVTAPVADAGSLTDVTDECSATPVAPTATDNCDGSVNGTPDVTFPITTQGTTVVTWTYTDGNGNSSTQTQNVIITDVTVPVADAGSLADVIGCLSVTPTAPTATDNCSGSLVGSPDVTFPVTASGTTVVTWTYTDATGNIATQVQNVIVDTVNANVTQSGATLTASAVGAAYVWLDCNNSFSPIVGETAATFTPSVSVGSYAVEVTENGCVDTSACFVVDFSSLEKSADFEVMVYPNPANGVFNIKFIGVNQSDLQLNVLDMQGKIIFSELLPNVTKNQIQKVDISNKENGVYLIKIQSENGEVFSKMITKI